MSTTKDTKRTKVGKSASLRGSEAVVTGGGSGKSQRRPFPGRETPSELGLFMPFFAIFVSFVVSSFRRRST